MLELTGLIGGWRSTICRLASVAAYASLMLLFIWKHGNFGRQCSHAQYLVEISCVDQHCCCSQCWHNHGAINGNIRRSRALRGWHHHSHENSNLLLSPLHSQYNRRKVPHHSEKGTTSPTRLVAVVVRLLTTSKRTHAPAVVTPPKRWGATTGHQRPRVAEPSVLDVWDTWRLWPAGLRMDLGRELKPRKWLPARIK